MDRKKISSFILIIALGILICQVYSKYPILYKFVTGNGYVSTDTLKKEEKRADSVEIASNEKSLDQELFLLLQTEQDPFVRQLIASHPNVSQRTLQALAQDTDFAVRWALARNPQTPTTILDKLAFQEDVEIREEVAANPGISLDLLKTLAQDRKRRIRSIIVENPTASSEVLDFLLVDQDPIIQGIAKARHLKTSTTELADLAQSDEPGIRRAVAKNKNTPLEVLKKLANDLDSYVSQTALGQLNKEKESLQLRNPK